MRHTADKGGGAHLQLSASSLRSINHNWHDSTSIFLREQAQKNIPLNMARLALIVVTLLLVSLSLTATGKSAIIIGTVCGFYKSLPNCFLQPVAEV